jgi:hypothetical protein
MDASGNQSSATWTTSCLAAIRAADAAVLADPRMEHRWGQRRSCRARVRVSAGAGVAATVRVRNVSISGAFLETTLRLPLFSQVDIAVLRGDGSTHGVEFAASVVRAEPGGIGIEWCEPVLGSICPALGCTMQCGAAACSQKK